jgi:2-keto-3-deoxy-L-arabinonate dehydratase
VKSFRGVYPIVCTTFRDDGSIDFESQRRLVSHLLEAGAHGLGLFGNASEGYTLAGDERTELLNVILEEVGGRVPVIVSTGHTGTDAAVALSRDAEASGADGVMVVPPYFLKPDGDGIAFYFHAIAEAIRIPIMLQDAPLMTGVAIGPPLLARIHRESAGVRYAKIEAPPTAPKITETRQLAEGLGLFGGLNGQFVIEEFERGAIGTMPGSDLVQQFVRIWQLLDAGCSEDAWSEFTRILPLIRFELQPGLGVSAMKHNLKNAGVITSTRVRHPTRALDARGEHELDRLRARLAAPAL